MTVLRTFITSRFPYFLLSLIYAISNLIILTRFPFVHSDETWLSGLSRNIMETGSYAATESFFDLYPRNPHAIKSLFHTLQILMIKVLGYEIFTVRVLSFLFGMLTLLMFYKLCTVILGSEKWAFAGTLLLAPDIQFIYAAHFARQEIMLLFVLIFSLNYFLTHLLTMKRAQHVLLGILGGLSVGLHPNSFIIALPLVFLYLFHIVVTKKLRISALLAYAAPAAGLALGFVGLSFAFDPDFIAHYLQYGSQFGVTHALPAKFSEILDFYLKLYNGISGTYYTPDIRLEFYLFAAALLSSIIGIFRAKDQKVREILISILLTILAINTGIVLIGRFSQPSIIFLFPLFYILVTYMLIGIRKNLRVYAALLLLLLITANSAGNILPYLNHSYAGYLQEIGKAVAKDDTVLANLNAEMYFDNGKLYDYRNLAYLQENHLTFADYIERNKIAYIIYPDEMDYIFAYRPAWNNVYGDISLYYADMQTFLQTKAQLVYQFTEPTYGMRIAQYVNQKPWQVRIYKVNP